jgi:hypothetical protein
LATQRPLEAFRPIVACTATLNLCWGAAFAVYFVFLARELDLSPAAIGLVLIPGEPRVAGGAMVAGRVTAGFGVDGTLVGTTFCFAPSWALVAVAPEAAPIPFLIPGPRVARERAQQHHHADSAAVRHTRTDYRDGRSARSAPSSGGSLRSAP